MANTYSTGTGPKCPHCFKEQDSLGSDYWAEKAGSGTRECEDCGKTYEFSVDYTTHYRAKPASPNRTNGEKP